MLSSGQILRVPIFVLAALIASCGGDGGTAVDAITSVSVSPGSSTLQSIGATVQLSAVAGGSGAAGVTFVWSSSAPAIASVDANGLVTAVSNGTATVTAGAQGTTVSGTASITVAQAAASMQLTPATGTLSPGETLQISVAIQDANGSAVAAGVTWTSSDEAVATVDSDGLVTAVDVGEAVITASQDAASGTAAITVTRADFMPDEDVTLGGTVSVAEMAVPAGVTVTLTSDAVIDASGPVSIAGNMIGDCVGLSLTGQDAVTISGTFSNACSDVPTLEDPPTLRIVGNAIVTLDGATITSSGDIFISNELPTPVGLAPSRRAAGAAQMDPTLSMAGTTVQHSPASAANGEDVTQDVTDTDLEPVTEVEGNDGEDGRSIVLRPLGLFFIEGSTIAAQDGGDGGSVTVTSSAFGTPPVARGGYGGEGGDVDLLFSASDVAQSGIPLKIQAGDGGRGGNAAGTGLPNPSVDPAPGAHAIGGDGGLGGEVDADVGQGDDGAGGRGGDATATAARGADATPTRIAQQGGTATALGGSGGGGDSGGDGGKGTAVAGDGGDGEPLVLRDAANGGGASGKGGSGEGGGEQGAGAVSGGNGGDGADACFALPPPLALIGFLWVLSDPALSDVFVFGAGGSPGIGFAVALLLLQRGGNGGDGGTIIDVEGGDSDFKPGTAGPGFNGGDGGDGALPGAAGNPGTQAGGTIDEQVQPLLQPGTPGGACAGGAPSAATVLATIGPAATAAEDRSLTLTGAAPWINVAGTVAEDGTVTATGRGTMAGTPDVRVDFTGTYDEGAGTLVGSYSMDPEKIISGGHPLVYSIDVAVPAPTAVPRERR